MHRHELVTLCLLAVAAPAFAKDPDRDEERVLGIISRLGGSATVQEDIDGPARVVAKFDSLTDAQAAALKNAACIVAFEVMDASRCTDRTMDVVRTMPNLQRLVLNKPAITDRGLWNFKTLSNLKCLYLGEARIGDVGVSSLKPLTNLEELDLYNTRVTDKSVPVLTGLTKLKSLNLAGTKVTDAGVKQLTELKSLTELNVQLTKVTQSTIRAIEDAIPGIQVRR